MTARLSVCFVWHMHQPLYKDRLSGIYLMPWVRLHAIKDYLDMALILNEFPKVRQTFNMVPSLIEQLKDYALNDAVDQQLLLTCKASELYTVDDKAYLISESFHANIDRQIKPYAHYFDLYNKRLRLQKQGLNYESMIGEFSEQEFADMATWMNLAWFDPLLREKYSEIKNLIKQGKDYSLEQRKQIIAIERQIIADTLPAYKRMQEEEKIEVITSPYYHPILPLLIDSNVARLPNPNTTLPTKLFFHRQDAQKQLQNGLSLYEKELGCKALGMWPSEMSISPAALELIAENGINWVVVDEAILSKTLNVSICRDQYGNLDCAETICQPYRFLVGDKHINIFFREVVTSNEISFSYGGREAEEAATAFHKRLKHIQQRLLNWEREGVVVVALDGENCWETYESDGIPFLRALYKCLSQDNTLNVCTVSDYLRRNPATEEIYNIYSGSWIGADYHIWIGDPVKNKAWDLLGETRNFLVDQLAKQKYDEQTIAKVWEEIYAAEGSDWFWWFGEPNNSAHDHVFDQQFRLRLQNVYKLLDRPYPRELDVPVADQIATASGSTAKEQAAVTL